MVSLVRAQGRPGNVQRPTYSTHCGALNRLQYLDRWEMSCTPSCFEFNDVATLHKRAYRPADDGPTPTRVLFFMVLNLSVGTRGNTFMLEEDHHHLGGDDCKNELILLEATLCSTTIDSANFTPLI